MAEQATPPLPLRAEQVRTFGALGNNTFRQLWASSWAYYTYRAMELAVLSWLVLETTNSPTLVALVGAMRSIPMFLLGFSSGAMADRLPRRQVMVSAQLVNVAVGATMLLLLAAGQSQPWHAFIAILITGASWAVDFATRRAFLADIFTGRALTNAMALDIGLLNATNLTGPIIGTVLIRLGGFPGAYAGITLLALTGLALVLTVAAPRRPRSTAAQNPLKQLRAGVGLLRANRAARAAVLVTIALNLFGWPMSQMVPVIARDVLGTSEVLYGVLAGSIGMGAIVGAVLLATFSPTKHGAVYVSGTLLWFVASLVFAASPWYLLSLFALLTAGIGIVMFGIMQPIIALNAVAPEERGRAIGAVVLGIGASPPGMVLIGLLADWLGPQIGLAIMSGTGLLVTLLLRRAFASLRDQPERR